MRSERLGITRDDGRIHHRVRVRVEVLWTVPDVVSVLQEDICYIGGTARG